SLLKKYGPPDFVLNNAAILCPRASVWQVEDIPFSEQLDINVRGVVNVIRHFIPAMMAQRRGVIVNFGSRWGRKVDEKIAPYCATKWAVAAITRALSAEMRPYGITVVELNPGVINTSMLRSYLGDSSQCDMSKYPTPIEWAEIAVPLIL